MAWHCPINGAFFYLVFAMATLTDNALLRSIAKSIGAASGTAATGTTIVDLVTSKIDPNNSTDRPMTGGAQFVGQWVDVSGYSAITIAVASDVGAAPWGLKFEWSLTGSGAAIATNSYYNNSPFYRSVSRNVTYPYFRVRYINGPTYQERFNLTSILQRLPIVSVDVSAPGETDTELTPPQTLADNLSNFTVPIVGAASLYWTGSVWARSQLDSYLVTLTNDLNAVKNSLDVYFYPAQSRCHSNTNGVATVTFPASINRRYSIDYIAASLSADPASAVPLTITSPGADTFSLHITKSGAAPFALGWLGAVSQPVTVSLAAAGPGIVGNLNVSARLF